MYIRQGYFIISPRHNDEYTMLDYRCQVPGSQNELEKLLGLKCIL